MKKILKESSLNINEDNANFILAQGHLIIDLNIKSGNREINLSSITNKKPKCLGKNYYEMTEKEKQQVEKYKIKSKAKTILKSIVPAEDLKEITSLQNSLRNEARELCTLNHYMRVSNYNILKQKIKDTEEKINNQLDKIQTKWDEYVKTFKDETVKAYHIGPKELNLLENKIKSFKDFKEGFEINCSRMPIATDEAVQGLVEIDDEEKKNLIKENNLKAIKNIENIIGSQINYAFNSLNKILLSNKSFGAKNSSIIVNKRTMDSLQNLTDELNSKLGWLSINSINELIEIIEETVNTPEEEIIFKTQETLSKIYKFMDENDLLEYLNLENSVMDEELLKIY